MSGPGLAGKVALVTGASRGIGRAIARALANDGAELVLCSTTDEGVSEVVEALKSAGHRAVGLRADVGRPEEAEALVRFGLEAFGRIDILVNDAAICPRKPVEQMTDEDYDRTLAVNLSGPFYLARRVLPGMRERGWGRIVNVSSISGTLGTPSLSAYCASKWGLNGLTKALAEELKGTGVSVTAVLPGSVDTDMLKGSGFTPVLEPEEIADVVLWLCGKAPEGMAGSLVEVFG